MNATATIFGLQFCWLPQTFEKVVVAAAAALQNNNNDSRKAEALPKYVKM